MNLKHWLDRGDIQKIIATEKSLNDLKLLIERDLKDAQIQALSLDRRFATAYGAALNIASYIIRKSGHRVSAKRGHHRITFEVATLILGNIGEEYGNYFDLCRRKRNKVDYDFADVVSETEVNELILMANKFKDFVFLK